jgi:hypothetical protein
VSGIIFQDFDVLSWVFSIAAAVIIPLIWTGVCLPLTYWFESVPLDIAKRIESIFRVSEEP